MSTTGILITIGATIVGYVLLMDAFYQLARRLSRETFTAAPPPARRSCSCGWQARPGAEWCARCGHNLADPSRPREIVLRNTGPVTETWSTAEFTLPEWHKADPVAEAFNRKLQANITGPKP